MYESFFSKLGRLCATKYAEMPIYQRAFNAQLNSPTWNPGSGIAQNIGSNVQQWQARGQRMQQDDQVVEDMKQRMNPGYAWDKLRATLGGRIPFQNPIDQALFMS